MKRNKRRLPLPQHEFGFAPNAFNLLAEVSLDGDLPQGEGATHAAFLAKPVAELAGRKSP